MITVAKAKKHTENVVFQVQDINTIRNTSFDQKFDLIFSNFGGLNCLAKSQLEQFLKTAHNLLTPNGKLIMVIMPKKCLWETLYFSLKGDFKKANRRNTNNSLAVHVDGVTVKTWYYNPQEILSLTKKEFTVNKIKPIGLAIPPSYLESSILAKNPLLSIFKGIDSLATSCFWAKYADHFLIELTKK
jgi:hypothetical protein